MEVNQTNLKTIIPAVVGAGVLAYEGLSGNKVLPAIQDQIVNACLCGATIVVTAWGIWQNHHKTVVVTAPVVPAPVVPAPVVSVPVQEVVTPELPKSN